MILSWIGGWTIISELLLTLIALRRILNRRKYRERYGPRELEQLLQLRTVTADPPPEKIHSAPWSPAIDSSAAAMDLWFAPTIARAAVRRSGRAGAGASQ
jgi:hypothetical protein